MEGRWFDPHIQGFFCIKLQGKIAPTGTMNPKQRPNSKAYFHRLTMKGIKILIKLLSILITPVIRYHNCKLGSFSSHTKLSFHWNRHPMLGHLTSWLHAFQRAVIKLDNWNLSALGRPQWWDVLKMLRFNPQNDEWEKKNKQTKRLGYLRNLGSLSRNQI